MGNRLDVVVIGAGHAGLATSYHLKQRWIHHLVLERGRVGETGHSQRWDTFRLNTNNDMSWLPGMPYEGDAPNGLLHRDEFLALLDAYIDRFGLPVQTATNVTHVSLDGDTFNVMYGRTRYRARSVVVASGIQNKPAAPRMGAKLSSRIVQLHTAEYRNLGELAAGSIMIVGSAQSGCQIAEDLLEAGRRVYMATSRVGRVVRRYRGRDTLGWLLKSGFFDQSVSDLEDPVMRYRPWTQISVTPGGHTNSLQQLARDGVTLLGRLADSEGDHLRLEQNLAEQVRFGDQASAWSKKMIDDFIERAGVDGPAPAPDLAEAPNPVLNGATPESLDVVRRESGRSSGAQASRANSVGCEFHSSSTGAANPPTMTGSAPQ